MSILSSVGSGQLNIAQKRFEEIYKKDTNVRFKVEYIDGKVIATIGNRKDVLGFEYDNPINIDANELPCPIKFEGHPRVQFFFFTKEYQFKNIPTIEELEKQTSQYTFQGASFRPEMIMKAYDLREHLLYSNIYLPKVFVKSESFKPYIQEFEDKNIDTARFIKRVMSNNNTVYILEQIPDRFRGCSYEDMPYYPMEYQKITEEETSSRIWIKYITHCKEKENQYQSLKSQYEEP